MRRLIYSLLYHCGAVALMRFLHRKSLTIVLYHGVAPKADTPHIYNYRGKFIDPTAFEKQLRYFKKHYTILDLDEAVERLKEKTLPPRALAITFDDGYRNFYTHALPILQQYGVCATMFLATDFVFEKKALWVDRLEYAMGNTPGLRRDKIQRDDAFRHAWKRLSASLREEKLFALEYSTRAPLLADFAVDRAVYAPLAPEEIAACEQSRMRFGAHTKTHPILSMEDTATARDEIVESVRIVGEHVAKPSKIFAYPNGQRGDWTADNERAIEEAGCTAALTTIEGVNTAATPPFRLKRMVLDATDSGPAFAVIASGMRIYLSKIKRLYA